MGIAYKRKGEEVVKKCRYCGVVWKDSWLDEKMDTNRCPSCHKPYHAEVEISLEPIIFKKRERIDEKIITIESRIKEIDCKLVSLESIPVIHTSVLAYQGEHSHHETFDQLRARYNKISKERSELKMKRLSLIMQLSKLKKKIHKSKL